MTSKKSQLRRKENTNLLKSTQEEGEETASMDANGTTSDAGQANAAQNSNQDSVILAAIN